MKSGGSLIKLSASPLRITSSGIRINNELKENLNAIP
jgi:hypothetical protein